MTIQQKISEVRGHIDELQQIAKKHLASGNREKYKVIIDLIRSNKAYYSTLRSDLKKKQKIILYDD